MTRKSLARRIRFRGEVESRHDANDLLETAGDVVLVNRVRPRSLVIACPDGCGATLTVNLDARTGKAWRFYRESRGITLYPSVWRDHGCEAHFILWRDHLIWFGKRGVYGVEPEYDLVVEARVEAELSPHPQSADDLAKLIDDIPWEVTRALSRLVRQGRAKVARRGPDRFVSTGHMSPDEKRIRPGRIRSWWASLWRR